MKEQPDLGFSCIDGTLYIHDNNPNKVYAYVRKGAKPVVHYGGLFYRILRFIGLGVFAKKPYIEWVGGEYLRDTDADLELKEQPFPD